MTGSPSRLRVEYCVASAPAARDRKHTLALLDFGEGGGANADCRHVRVPLQPLHAPAPRERWCVDADVIDGSAGGLRWSTGGGWRFVVIEIDESGIGIESASERAYDLLLRHAAGAPERHLLRIWNYLDAINAGTGDDERYRLFCSGRARALAAHGVTRYPAATAIGHHGAPGRILVYALCAAQPGRAFENPRQLSAWRYPRQYGPRPPNFARGMRLPNGTLAISGTAAVVGHASHHAGDVAAQAREAVANLQALLKQAALGGFDAASPLKIYVRNPEDAATVRDALAGRLDPSVPLLFLHGDICRRELLVEIDGWRFAP